MKRFNQFIEGRQKVFETEQDIPEGRITSSVIKGLAMFIKKKVINYSKRLKSQDDINNKIDLLSSQCSALASLLILNLAMEDKGEGLMSKGIIATGFFTETDEFINEEDIRI